MPQFAEALGVMGSAVVGASLALASCGFPAYEFSGASATGAGGGQGGHGADTGQAGTGVGGSGGAGGGPGCTSSANCTDTPATPWCDAESGACVKCLPGPEDDCGVGYYCTAMHACKAGCKTDGECNAGPEPDVFTCDPMTHTCVGCSTDDDCPPGKLCDAAATTECVDGCTPEHACAAGQDCCSGRCAILVLDVNHCGTCDVACPPDPPNATPICKQGQCEVECESAHGDCNFDAADGCEANTKTDPDNCGICGNGCVTPTPNCADGVCAA